MCTNGDGQSPVYTGKLTCAQVVARQARLAIRGLASYADGNGYMVERTTSARCVLTSIGMRMEFRSAPGTRRQPLCMVIGR
jgi:hypothetical protein